MGTDEGKSSSQAASDILNEVMNRSPAPQAPAKPAAPAAPAPAPAAPAPAKPEEGEVDLSNVEVPASLLGIKDAVPAPATKPDGQPAPEEPDDIKNANQKTRHAFAALRAELNQARDDLKKAREAQPQPAQPAGQTPEQILEAQKQVQSLQAKLNEAYDKIGRFSLEADPRFQAKYAAQQNALIEQVKATAKEWEIDDDTIAELIKATPKKRAEIIDEKAPDASPMIVPLLANYDHIERLKQMELARHSEIKSQLDAEQQKQHAMADSMGRQAMLKAASEAVLQAGHFILNPIPGNEGYNKVVAIMHAKIRDLFSKDDPLEQSKHLILGVTAPVYLSMWKKEMARRVALEKELKDRYGIRPGLDSRETTPPNLAAQHKDGASAADIVRSVMAQESANR